MTIKMVKYTYVLVFKGGFLGTYNITEPADKTIGEVFEAMKKSTDWAEKEYQDEVDYVVLKEFGMEPPLPK